MKKTQFGNLLEKKKRVLARLNGIQKSMAIRPSSSLLDFERRLYRELDVILDQERDLWALKSQVSWMVVGDRNTSFFHVTTLVRRKRNKIFSLKNNVGEWMHEEREVMEFIKKGYEDLYSISLLWSDYKSQCTSEWQFTLLETEKDTLNQHVVEEEIKAALWSMNPFKAQGPVGLHAGFFQRLWHIVGKSVVDEVKEIFLRKKMFEYLNKTLIALILKISSLETIGNYKPISLCNKAYETVTKVIVGRLRPYLDKLISPYRLHLCQEENV